MHSSLPTLPRVHLGVDGPLVGSQGLGCMGMSEFYGATDTTEARATLEQALDLGVTLFDTADMYGLGANESLLSPFVKAHRQRVVIATKFGYTRTAERPDDWSLSNRPEHIRHAVDQSLRRLGIDTIDLYYMHRRTPDVPLEDSVGTMAELVKAGKVRALGLCEVSAEELRAAHAIHPIAALQSEWSVFSRQIEQAVAPVASSLGITIVPYAPLGRGLLTGAAFGQRLETDDSRRHFPRFQPENQAANAHLVATLDQLAKARGISTAQLALAWLQTRARQLDVTVVPIPGTRRRARLMENVAAATLVLDEREMAVIAPLAAAVQGVSL
ncbi:Predicted oxidoreductase [Roseateles sp. YR242]|uniref:aldo/keto reductase n=1 Tax=Roseateles sp. YR242 TaxID=1855305 RepID=UPI0008D2D838|nr:aldo/keto reductase [Roseateles sp. YR242]SEK82358.1 Predicted oxidoreductase [Roseateles sp. YR242]